jgi:K+-transporting ATPase ATPase A chain
MANNNGSAFAGIKTNIFYNILGGISMLIGRYWIMIPTLAIAGSMGRKKIIPNSSATLPTTSWLFILILVGFIIIIGSLIFLPVFSLGPLIEHLVIWSINE